MHCNDEITFVIFWHDIYSLEYTALKNKLTVVYGYSELGLWRWECVTADRYAGFIWIFCGDLDVIQFGCYWSLYFHERSCLLQALNQTSAVLCMLLFGYKWKHEKGLVIGSHNITSRYVAQFINYGFQSQIIILSFKGIFSDYMWF